MWKKLLILCSIALFLTSCSLFRGGDEEDYSHLYFDIKLSELASDRNAEYSSLCWYGEDLILLPQYPSYFRSKLDQDIIFMISKEKLSRAIKNKGKRVVEPETIQLINNETYKLVPGYEGFEGICYDGEFFYLTVEYNSKSNKGVLVKAKMSEDGKQLEILNNQHLILDLPAQVFNASYESIFVYEDHIYLIYEANGIMVNQRPLVKKISKDFETVTDLKFDHIEYRITDVTSFDETGRGWAINYFWPGDAEHYKPVESTINSKFADANNLESGIERIIPLIITDNQVKYDRTRSPIYIKKTPRSESYNWEGIVKYGSNSFLLATDKFPHTVLRFLKK